MSTKRTFQPNNYRKNKKIGFRARMFNPCGRKIICAKRKKKRKNI